MDFLRSIRRSALLSALGKLVSASFTAQFISLVAMMAIARLYSASDFGLFAVALSISAILSVIASGRYEFAVLNPKEEDAAFALILSAMTLSLLFSILLLVFAVTIIVLSDLGLHSRTIMMALPPLTFSQSAFQIFSKFSNRQKNYSAIAIASVSLALCTNGAQILLGLGTVAGGVVSLVAGYTAGSILTIIILMMMSGVALFDRAKHTGASKLREVMREYWRFPAFSMPQSVVSKAVSEGPVVLMGAFFGNEASGLFSLTRRVLNKPIQLLGNNVAYVYHERVARATRLGKPAALRTTLVIVALMGALGIAVSIIILAFGPRLFGLLFGIQWEEAGRFAQVLLPLLVFRGMAVAVGPAFFVYNRHSEILIFQLVQLGLIVGAYLLGQLFDSVYLALTLHSFSASVTYAGIVIFVILLVGRLRPTAD